MFVALRSTQGRQHPSLSYLTLSCFANFRLFLLALIYRVFWFNPRARKFFVPTEDNGLYCPTTEICLKLTMASGGSGTDAFRMHVTIARSSNVDRSAHRTITRMHPLHSARQTQFSTKHCCPLTMPHYRKVHPHSRRRLTLRGAPNKDV